MVDGPSSVIESIAAGRKAASSIDKYLGGDGDISEKLIEYEAPDPRIGFIEGFADKPRASMACLPSHEAIKGFAEFACGLPEAVAIEEARRCLQCDLRFTIKPAIMPPEKRLEFNEKNVAAIPDGTEGVYILVNEANEIIAIKGDWDIKKLLLEKLEGNTKVKYFEWEKDAMYSKERK